MDYSKIKKKSDAFIYTEIGGDLVEFHEIMNTPYANDVIRNHYLENYSNIEAIRGKKQVASFLRTLPISDDLTEGFKKKLINKTLSSKKATLYLETENGELNNIYLSYDACPIYKTRYERSFGNSIDVKVGSKNAMLFEMEDFDVGQVYIEQLKMLTPGTIRGTHFRPHIETKLEEMLGDTPSNQKLLRKLMRKLDKGENFSLYTESVSDGINNIFIIYRRPQQNYVKRPKKKEPIDEEVQPPMEFQHIRTVPKFVLEKILTEPNPMNGDLVWKHFERYEHGGHSIADQIGKFVVISDIDDKEIHYSVAERNEEVAVIAESKHKTNQPPTVLNHDNTFFTIYKPSDIGELVMDYLHQHGVTNSISLTRKK